MTKKKAPKRTYVAEIEIKSVYAELVPAKKEGRPPRQVGQGRHTANVRLHGVTIDELRKRVKAATVILEKGLPKPPAAKKTNPDDPPKRLGEKEELQNYLETHGIKFNIQLGVKKLKALVQEHKDKTGDKTPLPDGK